MTTDYVGSVVKVRLVNGDTIQGKVTKVTASSLSLVDIHNNNPKQTRADLLSHEITDVDIVTLPPQNVCEQKPITIMRRDGSPNRRKSPQPPNPNDVLNEPSKRRQFKKEDTFSESTTNMTTDFDFLSSNKLFQKEAIFDEWRLKDGSLPKQISDKLKPSDMVIESAASLPAPDFQGHFLTDDQIPVTGLSLSKRIALFKRVISSGLSYSHAVCVAGLTITQMVIQVIGGSCRINAQNHNKPPVVAVLVSSGESGKVALTMALHLHQHGLIVKVVIMALPNGCDGLVNMLNKSKCVQTNGLQSLPAVIDIIIDGTQDRNTLLNWPDWLDSVIKWTCQSTAPILVIDPQHPNQMPKAPAPPKWTCALGAPLLSQGKVGRLFLVDIGLCSSAFVEENIPYRSPFFDKFIIPLHRISK